MPIHFESTIPILHIFDIAKAEEFYVRFLGFTIDWKHRFDDRAPAYIQISQAGLVLHLTEHHGDCRPGSAVFVWMHGDGFGVNRLPRFPNCSNRAGPLTISSLGKPRA